MQLHSAKQRRGFTLVELAVVIGIISLLAAALLPAIWKSVESAKNARIGIDLAGVGKALERYKLEFGEYPPDFAASAFLHETGTTNADGQDAAEVAATIINQHLSRVYRRRMATTFDASGNITAPGDLILLPSGAVHSEFLERLSPANAIVFWLSGFSSNPQFPFQIGTSRSPIFEFDKARFSTESLMAEAIANTDHPIIQPDAAGLIKDLVVGYLPPGVTVPYIYYNSSSYSDPVTMANNASVAWAVAVGQLPSGDELPFPYLSPTNRLPGGGFGFAADQKFQLISAGLDSLYGGDLNPNDSDNERPALDDNITSTTDGMTVEDFLDR